MLSVSSDHGYCVASLHLRAEHLLFLSKQEYQKQHCVYIQVRGQSRPALFSDGGGLHHLSNTQSLPKKNEDTERVTDVIVCEFLHVD